jgi:FG-GAP-like repeat/HYR domain
MRQLLSPSRKRPSFFSRFKSLIQLSLIAALLLASSGLLLHGASRTVRVSAYSNPSTAGQEPLAKAHFSGSVSIQAAKRGGPWINLSDGQDLITGYRAGNNISSFNLEHAQALSLTSADFDEDGIADLISGYQMPGGGTATLLRGNIDSIYPNTPEAQRRRLEGTATETPFIAPAIVFELPEKPDFMEAGDFNADGHSDLIVAARGGTQLYFFAGNGKAGFAAPQAIALNGEITTLKSGEVNRADGLADLVVGITRAEGARLVVFEGPQGAIASKPESIDLPAAAADLGIDYLDGDNYGDIAVAAGRELLIVSGRDRKLTLTEAEQASVATARISHQLFPVELSALAIGDFAGDLGLEIAVLSADGSVQLLQQGAQQQTQSAKSSAAWQIKTLSAMGSATANKLLRVRVSSLSHENLLIIDPAGHQVRIWMSEEERLERGDPSVLSASGQSAPTILNIADEPMAVYPMRLNRDALSDLVILRKGNLSPAVVRTEAVNDFCVTTKNDCTGCGSLRDAIANANSSPGMDEISFNDNFSGSTQTITLSSPLPSLTEAVVLDGTSNCGSQSINKVRVDGSNNLSRAVNLPSGGSVVRGLVVTRFNNGMQVSASTGNIIEGNFIGVDAGGNNARGNGRGVMVSNAANNTIGGTASPATNIISGNTTGIEISGNNATGNLVRLNLIGVTANNNALGNDQNGVDILSGAARNTIGGTTPQPGGLLNIIAGNMDGVSIQSATSNLVQSCLLDLNRHNGVTINAQGNTVGGASNALLNAVWRSQANGVELNGNLATDNLVQGNYLGVNFAANGSVVDMANLGHGILITNNGSRNAIGGVTASAGNLIALNHGNGITVVSGIQNQIFSNRIAGNTLLGIDLGNNGPTANDDKDGDTGPNDLQNFPVLTGAVVTGTASADEVSALAQSVTVSVSFNSTPNQNFFLQFFIGGGDCTCKTASCLGSLPLPLADPMQVTTGADGNFSSNFTFPMPTGASSTGFVNATATSLNGSTSELSQCVALGTQGNCAPICPANQTKDAGAASSVQVTYPDAALPGGCPGVTVSCAPPSGSTFPVGVTTVTCTAKEGANTRGTCSFNVTVTGPPGPAITNVVKEGKSFVITGTGFADGAKVMVNGVDKKTRIDSPTSIFSKKGAKAVSFPASIQIRAADNSLSNIFILNQP